MTNDHQPAPVMAYDGLRHEYVLADGTTLPAEALHAEGTTPSLPDLTHPALAARLTHIRDQMEAAKWEEIPRIVADFDGREYIYLPTPDD